MVSLGPDILRLLAVPVLGWAAWRDVRTRRVPNQTWYPLAALGVALLAWDVFDALSAPAFVRQGLFLRIALSLGLVVPLAYAFWRLGGFGGADAKAFMVVAVLFPAYPVYHVGGAWLPLVETRVGVFSLTVLTNTVLLGALYPVALFVRNAAAGRLSPVAFVGRPVRWDAVTDAHGRLLEGDGGFTRNGLDLDALRMYLRWRGATLADLRADPALRDPATLPADPNDPTDGAVATDGGTPAPPDADADPHAERFDDPWGAAAFLDDVDHGAYGTTPEQLRAGLSTLVESDVVWVSPGIPFLVPTFGGVLVGLTYGDLLFAALSALALA